MERIKRNTTVEQIKKAVDIKRIPLSKLRYLSTGSTLLNLAFSNKADGGAVCGTVINLIGDSNTGKTVTGLTLLAEASLNKDFKEYELIYDDVERKLAINISAMFGDRLDSRISAPRYDEDEEPMPSKTIQDFHENLYKCTKDKKCIYCLDSLDAVDSDEDQDKMLEQMKARELGKEIKGTYGMAKPKRMSWLLRHCIGQINPDSILQIISQTRDNIDPMSFQKKKRAGGAALDFYCTHVVWLAKLKSLKKKDINIGQQVKAKVTKNHITGKVREVVFSIYDDYGIDDVGSMVDFLIQEEVWKKKKDTIIAESLGLEGTRAKIIQSIEDQNLENKLKKETEKVWLEIEESLKLNRKPKY